MRTLLYSLLRLLTRNPRVTLALGFALTIGYGFYLLMHGLGLGG